MQKKKEEIAISLAVNVPNAKIIDFACSSNIPVSTKKNLIFLGALIPFMEEIPHSKTDDEIIIHQDARSSNAEAFRLIRTNLDFMLPNNKDTASGKTIFITSSISGEGKSFVSINLAAALSLSNKKVLLMGMDLRAPKVTEYLGIPDRIGITNFLTNNEIASDDIKFSILEIEGLDIISSGVIPPNPAELLLTNKINTLFEEVKKDYEYIIVDTAPVNMVSDMLLVAKYADMLLDGNT